MGHPVYYRKCKRRGVGGQKTPNFVNVVCERPPKGVLGIFSTLRNGKLPYSEPRTHPCVLTY